MQKKTKNALNLVFGFAVLVALVWGTWWGIVALGRFLTSLDSDLALVIVAAAATGIVSIVSVALSKAYETRANIWKDLRAKKTPVYEQIVEMLFKVMFADKLGDKRPTESELLQFFAKTTEQITIWGSDDLVKAFSEFKTVAGTSENPVQAIFLFEDLLLAIRRDLGHRNKGLDRGSILRLFITDIDEQLTSKP